MVTAALLLSTAGCAFMEVGGDGEAPGASTQPAYPGAPLPPPVPKPTPPSAAAPAEIARPPVTAEPPVQPGTHRVRSGESVYDIARRHGVDAYALITLNELSPPFDLEPGQVLILPGAAAAAQSGSTASRPVSPESGGRPVSRPAPATRDTDREESRTAALPKPSAPLPEPPQPTGGFQWPVQGRILSEFGPKKGGFYNDGINIAAPPGTPIRAAESGVVAYAGNELRGFGNMLLLKHAGGWVTTYAHASELLVKRGERVRRGQVIGKVGATGAVDQPQLHFEVRKGKRAVDPLRELPRPSAESRARDSG